MNIMKRRVRIRLHRPFSWEDYIPVNQPGIEVEPLTIEELYKIFKERLEEDWERERNEGI